MSIPRFGIALGALVLLLVALGNLMSRDPGGGAAPEEPLVLIQDLSRGPKREEPVPSNQRFSEEQDRRVVLVRGRIIDPTGASVQGVTVSIQPESALEPIQRTTDERGHFQAGFASSISSLALRIQGDGFLPVLKEFSRDPSSGDQPWELPPFELQWEVSLPLVLHADEETTAWLRAASLTRAFAKVVHAGAPFQNKEGDGNLICEVSLPIESGTSSRVVRLESPLPCDVQWILRQEDAVVGIPVAERRGLECKDGRFPVEELNLTVSLLIRGVVTSKTVGPLPGARVSFTPLGSNQSVNCDTSEDGAFVFPVGVGTEGRVIASYGSQSSASVLTRAGEAPVQLPIDLQGFIAIRVLSAAGNPVERYELRRQNLGARPMTFPLRFPHRPNGIAITKYSELETGARFFAIGPEIGECELVLTQDARGGEDPIELRALPVPHHDLTVHAGRRVVMGDLLTLWRKEPAVPGNPPVKYWSRKPPEGEWVVPGIPLGSYRFSVSRDSSSYADGDFEFRHPGDSLDFDD